MKSPQPSPEPIPQRFSFAAADALALGIVALGFWLRLGSIRDYWNNADEGIYYHIAHAPSAIANTIIAGNAHPPLYYYLLRAVASVSDEFVWLRVPALVFGTLSIITLYRLGARIGGAACGIAAAGVLALSPGAIELSQVARPYALQLFLLIGGTSALLGYWQNRRSRVLVGYSLWMLAAALTHYSSFLVLAGFGVALGGAAIGRHFSARELRALAMAHAPVLLLCVALYSYHVEPVLLDSAMRREAQSSWLGEYFAAGPLALWQNFLGVFGYLGGCTLSGVGSIVFLISLGACLHRKRFALVGMCLSVVLVAVAASALAVYPFGGTRHSAYLAPFLALPIGMAAAVTASMGRRATLCALLLLTAIVVVHIPVSGEAAQHPRGTAARVARPLGGPVGPQPEFQITKNEVDALGSAFDTLLSTPGIVFMDLSTTYTLLPLIREGAIDSDWTHPGGHLRQFRWGERRVIVIPYWYMAVRSERIDAPNHLWSSIRRIRDRPGMADLLRRNVYVISAEGMALPGSIRALSRGRDERRSVLDDVSRTAHLSVFRLHIPQYQQQLARRVRERSIARRNAAADATDRELSEIE